MKMTTLCLAAAVLTATALAQNQYVYTNDNASPATTGAPNTVSAFITNADGTLTLLPGSPFQTGGNGSNGGRLAAYDITIVSRARDAASTPAFVPNVLYAVNQGDGTLAAFRIDPATGNLTALAGSPFLIDGPPGGDYSITPSPDGRFLFIVNDATTAIRVYTIAPNGTISPIPGSPFETGTNWLGLKVTANGHFLIAGEISGNNVGVFHIAASGSITPVAGSPFPGSGQSAGVTATCDASLAFHTDNNHEVDSYKITSEGALRPVPHSPFLTTAGFNAGLTLTPNNRFLYVSDPFGNNNSSNISAFAVRPNGALSPVPGSPFTASFGPGGVAAMTTSADGKYLYSYMFVYSQVDVQTIAANGALTDLGSFFTGFAASGSGMGIASFPVPSCSP
jgi:6-phosphogluconolactonase (cycloisomerase 2 family)